MPAHIGQRAAFKPVSFWVPPEVRAAIEAAAVREDRNVSQWGRVAVMRELARTRDAGAITAASAHNVEPARSNGV